MRTLSFGILSMLIVGSYMLTTAFAADLPDVRTLKQGEASPPAKIEDLDWLAGRWFGEGLGGEAEEMIVPAQGGQMMGMFRHSKPDGSPNFYEFYLFTEKEGSLVLLLKHFTPEMTGWEEKGEYVEFPLIAIEGSVAYFDGITYAVSGEDMLTVVVNVSDAGNVSFQYRKDTIN